MAQTENQTDPSSYHYLKELFDVQRIDTPVPVELPDTILYTWSHLRTDHDHIIKSKRTENFLKSLSFDSYILAGGAVVDMIDGKPMRDLDLWVIKDPLVVLKEILEKYPDRNPLFRLFPSMVEIISNDPTNPPINLIYSGKSANKTIDEFDFDYCRCYYTHQTGIMAYQECLDCLKTRHIHDPIMYCHIRPHRYLKSIKKGFHFDRKFYKGNQSLGIDVGHCPIDNSDPWHGCKHMNYWLTPDPVNLKDIDTKGPYFTGWDSQVILQCTSIKEIEAVIDKLDKSRREIWSIDIVDYNEEKKVESLEVPYQYIRPPILAETQSVNLVKEHVTKIMIKYPVRYGNYEALYLC